MYIPLAPCLIRRHPTLTNAIFEDGWDRLKLSAPRVSEPCSQAWNRRQRTFLGAYDYLAYVERMIEVLRFHRRVKSQVLKVGKDPVR